MNEGDIHIYAPPATSKSFRVLEKGCRKFRGEYQDFGEALNAGLKECPDGFRIFRQSTYEWYEPYNKEVAKIGARKDLTI